MSDYSLQEPCSARALDFLDFVESLEFIMPSPTANGAAETDSSVCESMVLECKNLPHAEMVRATFKGKLIAMIRGKHLLIDI